METQAILTNPNLTKTEKIRQLLALGLTRRAVADLTGGNYGFVQNVFARYWPDQVRARAEGTLLRQPALGLAAEQAFSFIEFNRRFGVEIEAYNITRGDLAAALRLAGIKVTTEGYNHETRAYWKIVTDSSLVGKNNFEIVSPILVGTRGLAELETVCRVLRQKNAYVNRTCGLHIHFDAQAMLVGQVKNLLINYGRYEALIDSFMPNSRRASNNGYCLSLRGREAAIEGATSIQGLTSALSSRYLKVNMQAYTRHKTIEFRQHSGTIEFDKISNWVLFLHNLTEFSRTNRVAEPQATFENLARFQQPEILTFINNRISELAA